jgi:hypothetical protein
VKSLYLRFKELNVCNLALNPAKQIEKAAALLNCTAADLAFARPQASVPLCILLSAIANLPSSPKQELAKLLDEQGFHEWDQSSFVRYLAYFVSPLVAQLWNAWTESKCFPNPCKRHEHSALDSMDLLPHAKHMLKKACE